MTVEGDYSQLAFFAALGALGGGITCLGVEHGSRQGDRAVLDFLSRMGAGVEAVPGGWHICGAPLSGITMDISDCPDLGPILTVAAAHARGQSRLTGTSRLRIKESDRAAAMVTELSRLGAELFAQEDEILVHGGVLPAADEVSVCGHGDHRIVMSLAVMALCGTRPVVIDGAEAVAKSYPGFFDDLAALGAGWELMDD
jgi:3-phosphoshikimate 1-carboxyvinyltransferase